MDGHCIVMAGGPPQGPDQSQGGQASVGVFNLLHGSDEAVHVTQVETWQQRKWRTKENTVKTMIWFEITSGQGYDNIAVWVKITI